MDGMHGTKIVQKYQKYQLYANAFSDQWLKITEFLPFTGNASGFFRHWQIVQTVLHNRKVKISIKRKSTNYDNNWKIYLKTRNSKDSHNTKDATKHGVIFDSMSKQY